MSDLEIDVFGNDIGGDQGRGGFFDLFNGNFNDSQVFDLGLSGQKFQTWYANWFEVESNKSVWDKLKDAWEEFVKWWNENVKLSFGPGGWTVGVAGITWTLAVPKKIRDGVKNDKIQQFLDEWWPLILVAIVLGVILVVLSVIRHGN